MSEEFTEKQAVADEVLEQEFTRFAEAMDLDVELAGMNDEDKKTLLASKRIILRAMARGRLVINEHGEAVYTANHAGKDLEFRFYTPSGRAMTVRDTNLPGHDQKKLVSTIAQMTRQKPGIIEDLLLADFKVLQTIAILFLG